MQGCRYPVAGNRYINVALYIIIQTCDGMNIQSKLTASLAALNS